MNNASKIFGTELPEVLDQIIKRIKHEHKIAGADELKKYLKSKQGSDKAVIIVELEKELPKWKILTSSEDPEKYILQKMLYRVDRMMK